MPANQCIGVDLYYLQVNRLKRFSLLIEIFIKIKKNLKNLKNSKEIKKRMIRKKRGRERERRKG